VTNALSDMVLSIMIDRFAPARATDAEREAA